MLFLGLVSSPLPPHQRRLCWESKTEESPALGIRQLWIWILWYQLLEACLCQHPHTSSLTKKRNPTIYYHFVQKMYLHHDSIFYLPPLSHCGDHMPSLLTLLSNSFMCNSAWHLVCCAVEYRDLKWGTQNKNGLSSTASKLLLLAFHFFLC